MTGIAGDANDLNSQDRNLQFRASLRVTARAARLLDKFAPPYGTVLSTMLLFATFLSPFPTEQQETLDDVLRRVLSEKLTAFSDHLLQADLSAREAQMDEFSARVDFYTSLADGNLRADRAQIHNILNNNFQDTSFAFLRELGSNFINPTNEAGPRWESDPDVIANRIRSFYQVAQGRINLCRRIAVIFARMGNVDTTDMSDEERKLVENDRNWSTFWKDGQVAAAIAEGRHLRVLLYPPSNESSGTERVLRALYKIQSHEERRMFEDFMRDELGMPMPGTLLQIRNLSHNQYITVTEGECPRQRLYTPIFLQPWLSTGFTFNAACPYVETTSGAAGISNTDWNKMFVVYGNRRSFTLWNVGEG